MGPDPIVQLVTSREFLDGLWWISVLGFVGTGILAVGVILLLVAGLGGPPTVPKPPSFKMTYRKVLKKYAQQS